MNARTVTPLLVLALLAAGHAIAQQNAVATRHFEYLAKAAQDGKVILAGRTTEALDKTFGLVIFEAASEADAREFMLAGPAIVAQLMTATLHPYAVAMQRK